MGGRPRVLWLLKGLNQGGAETLLLDLLSAPALAAFEISLASASSRDVGMRSQFEDLGAAVHDLGSLSSWDFRWVRQLDSLLVEGHYGLVHAHSPLPAAAVRLLRRRSRVPLVCTEHNVRDAYRLETRMANRLTGSLDAHTFAVSNAVARSHQKRRRPVEVIHHGRRSVSLPLERPPHQGPLRVLVIANLRPEKNLANLLNAVALARRAGAGLEVTIVGDGVTRADLEQQSSTLGLDDVVVFAGAHADARACLHDADVLALSSDAEGLPVVVMEAFQAGVPVLATSVGGVPEVVTDGVNGLLVPRRDSDALARALLRLADEPDLVRLLGEGARIAAPRFDVDVAAARYAAVYRELLGATS